MQEFLKKNPEQVIAMVATEVHKRDHNVMPFTSWLLFLPQFKDQSKCWTESK